MKIQAISIRLIQKFKEYLTETEKAEATIEKYIRDITAFVAWLDGKIQDKCKVLEYKGVLIQK